QMDPLQNGELFILKAKSLEARGMVLYIFRRGGFSILKWKWIAGHAGPSPLFFLVKKILLTKSKLLGGS
ncbi:MAG: hypothetical protein ACLVFN_00490, partial [Enterocloster sp.]